MPLYIYEASRDSSQIICGYSWKDIVSRFVSFRCWTTLLSRFIGAARQLAALLLGHPQHSSAINSREVKRACVGGGVARCSCTICSCTWSWHVLPADNNRRGAARRATSMHVRFSRWRSPGTYINSCHSVVDSTGEQPRAPITPEISLCILWIIQEVTTRAYVKCVTGK